MANQNKYLTTADVRRPRKLTVRAIEQETVDGRPRLVLYFEEEEKGLLLTRELANDMTKMFGRSRKVEAFFANEGKVH